MELRLSTILKRKGIFPLPNMMDTYRTCEDHNSYIPYLIDDFFDFKRYVDAHMLDKDTKITSIKWF